MNRPYLFLNPSAPIIVPISVPVIELKKIDGGIVRIDFGLCYLDHKNSQPPSRSIMIKNGRFEVRYEWFEGGEVFETEIVPSKEGDLLTITFKPQVIGIYHGLIVCYHSLRGGIEYSLNIPLVGVLTKKEFEKILSPYAPRFIPLNWKKSWDKKPSFSFKSITIRDEFAEMKDYVHSDPRVLQEKLSPENYVEMMSVLLNNEQNRYQSDMRMYDMYQVNVTRGHSGLKLIVPGLAEQKPPLTIGDVVLIRTGELACLQYETSILHCDLLNESIHFASPREETDAELVESGLLSKSVNVRFLLSPGFWIATRQSLFLLSKESRQRLFMHKIVDTRTKDQISQIIPKIFDSGLNDLQREACTDILLNKHMTRPYFLHGPPGTGKTRTLIESIRQVSDLHPDSNILVLGPSNTSADILLQGLSRTFDSKRMFRLNSTSRTIASMPIGLLNYCATIDDRFVVPKTCDQHIIVTTTNCIPHLIHTVGLQPGYFSYIYVDENCQALEAELAISLNLAAQNTQLILAGDHLQLGPIVRSNSSVLASSFQERLLNDSEFRKNGNLKMLVKNYRSHPNILEFPSNLFYYGLLEPQNHKVMKWNILKNQQHPMAMYGIHGSDIREGESPSWYNPFEAMKVCDVVQDILKNHDVKEADIGIISPYRRQVQKIRVILRKSSLSSIRVGTVDDFQGQESSIVIISTVRSDKSRLVIDSQHSLGLINHQKRFNVAITRAMNLLVIIGDPRALCTDPLWMKLMARIYSSGNYMGVHLPSEVVEYADSKNEELLVKGILSENNERDEFYDDQSWRIRE